MAQTLLLPWFPIVLAVGVGGRLLGRTRGFGLGGLCALFWIVLVQAAHGLAVWQDPWNVVALSVGALAIILMGGWAGGSETGASAGDGLQSAGGFATRSDTSRAAGHLDLIDEATIREGTLAPIGAALEQFQDWLENHREHSDPWPEFGEFVRSVLYQCCHATHVKPYLLVPDKQELLLLRVADPCREAECIPARKGILGHVITTGRSFIASGRAGSEASELVEELAQGIEPGSPGPVFWCFAVQSGGRRLGAVSVGHLPQNPIAPGQKTLLRLAEQLINVFWTCLLDVTRCRVARDDDPASHLLNRKAFFQSAERGLTEMYDQNEPVALAVVGLGGLRRLNDCGRWELADELLREIGSELRRKVRLDDCLGRFDGSRFVWLLRRVDSDLARLIVEQIMTRLTETAHRVLRAAGLNPSPPGVVAFSGAGPSATIDVHCGLTGAGLGKPDLRTLLARALVQAHRARIERIPIATDLDMTAGRSSNKKSERGCEVCL